MKVGALKQNSSFSAWVIIYSDPTGSAPPFHSAFLLRGENYLTWNSLRKRFLKPFPMNEAAFFSGRCGSCPPQRLGNPQGGGGGLPPKQCGCSELQWLLLACPRFWVPLAPCPPTMQFLDPEELLVDEEDDVFGEGKHFSGRSQVALLWFDSVGNSGVLWNGDGEVVWVTCSWQAQGREGALSKGFSFKGLH